MIIELLKANLTDREQSFIAIDSDTTIEFLEAVDYAWVFNKKLSVPYWAEKIGQINLDNITYVLGRSRFITTEIQKKFGTITLNTTKLEEYLSESIIYKYREQIKLNKYRMRRVDEIQPSNLTSTPSGIKDTGLNHEGMAYAANNTFKLDTQYLVKYYDVIVANCIKSMKKMQEKHKSILDDPLNYAEISTTIIDYHIFNPEASFNLEANIMDQRGRSIYKALRRVFNPISNKDSRSMLIANKAVVITKEDTIAKQDIYLAIAELAGNKRTSWMSKALSGRASYINRELPDLDLSTKKGRKELHNSIWLQRIYKQLDTLEEQGYVLWEVPLEIDVTASMAAITGILLEDARLLNKTNTINSDSLEDFWSLQNIERDAIKAICTPVMYGSGASFVNLLKSKGLSLSKEHMKLIKDEFKTGTFSIMKDYKDFWNKLANINTPTFEVTIWDATFTVEVSKFKTVGTNIEAYTCYNTEKDNISTMLMYTTERIPDYSRFKSYFTTLITHHLDARLLDKALVKAKCLNLFAIGIHDAILCLPGSGMRNLYIAGIEQLRTDRHTITASYKESLNISGTKADMKWDSLINKVVPVSAETTIAQSVLK